MSLRNYLVTQSHTWILNESVSLQSHAIAVARAIGLPFDLKRLKVGGPLRYLPASLQVYLSPARFLASVASSDDLSWPRLIIDRSAKRACCALAEKRIAATLFCIAHSEPQVVRGPIRFVRKPHEAWLKGRQCDGHFRRCVQRFNERLIHRSVTLMWWPR